MVCYGTNKDSQKRTFALEALITSAGHTGDTIICISIRQVALLA